MNKLLKLNLQHFSDDTGDNAETGTANEQAESDKKENVEFTDAQQSKINELIKAAKSKEAKRARKEQDSIIEQRVQDELKKQQDYAKLSEDERERKQFEDAQAEFEKERAEFEHSKLVVSISKDLIEKDLPSEFAELLAVRGDNEKSLQNVSVFKEQFDAAVSRRVKENLKQPAVRDNSSSSNVDSYGKRLAQNNNLNTGKVFD